MRSPIPLPGTGLKTSHQDWCQALARATASRRILYPRLQRSPNRVLALRVKTRDTTQRLAYKKLFVSAARLRIARLPTLTLQAILRKQDLSNEPLVARAVAAQSAIDWRDILNILATKGWTREHLDHWIWILSGEDGDARVRRLVSSDDRKPLFLVLNIMRKDEVLKDRESILSLIRYILKNHLAKREDEHPVLELRRILTVTQFVLIIRRLGHHVRQVWPHAIGIVARLAMEYIKSIPNDPHHKHHRTDFRDQCRAYNVTIDCLSERSPIRPLVSMELQWRAQRLLLAMSDSLDKQLILNKTSYQAIRRVLVALKKSRGEKAVALRYAKTWPPYKREFDDADTKRSEEDDQSRSVKAGAIMKEAGYTPGDYDKALDALGGTGEGHPTVQTRTIVRGKSHIESDDIFIRWASLVRTARDAQEAWQVFNQFGYQSGLQPTIQVYNEMFLKLTAEPLDTSLVRPDLVPGEAREVFPVHSANYSEYEMARLAPPSLEELYDSMMNKGIKPSGYVLTNLVSNARTLEEGLRYLRDSGLRTATIEALRVHGRKPSRDIIWNIPLSTLHSYIKLLCRLQPALRPLDFMHPDEIRPIFHAIELVKLRLDNHTTAGKTYRPPWMTLLRALARRHIAIIRGTPVENDQASLQLFVNVYKTTARCVGIDAELMILLCRAIQKAGVSHLMSLPPMGREEYALVPFSEELLDLLDENFRHLTKSSTVLPGSSMTSNFQYPLSTPHLHSYMRALAYMDAQTDMIKLLFWIMDHHEYVNAEADLTGDRGHIHIVRTLCAFQAFAGPGLDESLEEELNERMAALDGSGASWRWPTEEELEAYLATDPSHGSEALHRRAVVKALKS